MQKTHLKLQQTGEVEDKRAVELAKSSNESRKMMKQFRHSHKGQLNKGEDVRGGQQMLKMKKKKILEKLRKGGKPKSDGKDGKSKYGEKQWSKIVKHSAPTRSKAIVKTGKKFGNSGSAGKFKGGKRR